VFAVFNDARMRMVEHGQTKVFGRAGLMHSHRVDFAALARSVGARGYTIRSAADFECLPPDIGRTELPTVLDIEIDPASSFPINGRVSQIRNFSAE
jgi:acetolactate synthase-1/2/3 large subunit